MSAIVDGALRNKATKGHTGIGWDREVEKVWKGIGGNKDEVLSIGESAGCKTKVRAIIETREKRALRRKVDEEEHLKINRGSREGIGGENIFYITQWTPRNF